MSTAANRQDCARISVPNASPPQVGEYTIVHAGFAISRLDEESGLESRVHRLSHRRRATRASAVDPPPAMQPPAALGNEWDLPVEGRQDRRGA